MRRVLLALAVLLLLALVPAPAADADEGASLEDALHAFVSARDPVARLKCGLDVTRLAPDTAAVVAALPGAWRWSRDVPTGKTSWERETPDGVVHTIFAFVPPDYTPDRAWPVLLWLHGGVSRNEDGGGEGGIGMFSDEAVQRGFLVLSPSTQDGSFWWSPDGMALIRGALRDLERRWRVDADRVGVAGMSDGGSGCLHLLVHDPDPYACFVPLVGNPLVTRIFGGPTWTTNVASRPMYAVSGGLDRLYPAERVKSYFDELKNAGCELTWIEEPEAGHDLSYLERRWPEILAFWQAHPRQPLPTEVTWTTSRPAGEGRRAWIEIRTLDPGRASGDGIEAPEALPLPETQPRPRLGIRLDTDFPGPGLRIQEVEDETPAAAAGLEAGDVILKAGEVTFPDVRAVSNLRTYLEGLGTAEGVFVVLRAGEEREVRVKAQVLQRDRPPRPQDLGYDVKPGTVRAALLPDNRIEITTDGVGLVRLHLADGLIDFDTDLVVHVNGEEVFRGRPPQDVAYLLTQVHAEGPGGPVYRGYLDLRVPE